MGVTVARDDSQRRVVCRCSASWASLVPKGFPHLADWRCPRTGRLGAHADTVWRTTVSSSPSGTAFSQAIASTSLLTGSRINGCVACRAR